LSDEQQYWARLLSDLQLVMTIEAIADEVQALPRQVFRWKAGEDRPMGLKAIRVYLLHVKRCPERQCPPLHGATDSVGPK
jgi:hypothetical protein